MLRSIAASAFAVESRSLSKQIEVENARAMTRNLLESSSANSRSSLNYILFWSINGLWLALFVAVVVWMWRFNGLQYLSGCAQRMAGHVESDSSDGRRQEETEQKSVSPETRSKLLSDYFRKAKVHMVVADDDILTVSTNMNADTTAPESCDIADSSPPSGLPIDVEGNDVADIEAGVVMEDANDLKGSTVCVTVESDSNGMKVLTRSLSTAELGQLVLHTHQGDRLVPNCCAVCLSPYEPGEDVVWSMNECCIHAFHEECVTEWLTKLQEGNSCPCCRSVFVDSYEDRPVKAICSWRPGPSLQTFVPPSLIGDES